MEEIVSFENLDTYGNTFWHNVKNNKLFAFHGEMGAGKTTIIHSLCKFKGVQSHLSSPTFSIINEYIYNEEDKECIIYHIDLYRLKSVEEAIQAGVEEAMYSNSICMVEWPEKAPSLFVSSTVHVFIKSISDIERLVKICLP